MHDHWLGGYDNFAPDRDRAARIGKAVPAVPQMVADGKAFSARAVSWAAGQGIAQFIDLGCGHLVAAEWRREVTEQFSWTGSMHRTDEDAHVSARAVNPAARVAYVDNDWQAAWQSAEHLKWSGVTGAAAICADLRDPDAVLGDKALREVIDLSEPVGLIFGMVLNHMPAARAHEAVAGYLAAVPAGSILAATVMRTDDPAMWGALSALWPLRAWNHTPRQFRALFGGLELAPPGIAPAAGLRPGWGDARQRPPGQAYVVGGIGRKA
jgi:hypothetical protein